MPCSGSRSAGAAVASGTRYRASLRLTQGPNQRWSLDFLHDQLSDGRRFPILAIVDDFIRECLALAADTSLSGRRVGRELDAMTAARGKPATCASDNAHRADQHGDPALVAGEWRRMALHRARKSRSRTPSSKASTAVCGTSC